MCSLISVPREADYSQLTKADDNSQLTLPLTSTVATWLQLSCKASCARRG